MLWRFGVRNGTGEVVDVVLQAPAGTPLSSLLPELRTLDVEPPATPHVAGAPLTGEELLGEPPLLQGVVLEPSPGTPAAGTLRARVVAGPDAAALHPLRPGRNVVGRQSPDGPPDVSVALADSRCSRVHAVLDVSRTGALRVRDAGSLNGTAVLTAGGPVAVTAVTEVAAGQRVRVGGSVLDVGTGTVVDRADLHPDGAGNLLLNRPPRLGAPPEPQRLRWPSAQPASARPGFPWLALLVPLAVAGVLAVLWSPFSLLLGLASPVLVGGQWVSSRRRYRAEEASREQALAHDRGEVSTRHADALAAERLRREHDHPGPGDVLDHAVGCSARLFERHPGDVDHLVLRVGLGTVAATDSSVTGEERDGDGVPDAVLSGVPVLVDLASGVLGVAGPRTAVLGCVRALLAQVAAWHSPAEVRTTVLGGPDGAQWRWLEWLPHHDSASLEEVSAVLRRRRADRAADPRTRPTGPALVLLVDGSASSRRDPRLADLLRDGPAHGLHAVCLDSSAARLPAECTTVVDLDDRDTAWVRTRTSTGPDAPVVPDALAAVHALELARALAPLQDATPSTGSALPTECRLLDVLGLVLDPPTVHDRWRRRGPGLPATLGVGAGGACVLDLVADGPHTLVAGTTGSGKSVLLSTLVAGLALEVPPDALQFVLVDYKGGAAFGGCTGLPHVAGVVTDLDEHLATRVLRSLRAEVRRREEVVRAAGVADVAELVADSPAAVRCPRLVVVVDEFRVLSAELPEFVDGLVRLAAVGRSLGIHLVLATQRPAGVVGPEIRANTNARIALRVQDRTDSDDVLGEATAAAISDRLPGRALLRLGTRGVEAFQTASLRGPSTAGVSVRRFDDPDPDPVPGTVDDLPSVVRVVAAAARLRNRPAAPVPWLPPLPATVAAGDLPPVTGAVPVPFGLLDLPDRQARGVASWDLATGGHLMVVGTVRSGRSTVLRTLVAAAPADAAEITVLDAGGTLGDLAALPQAASVVPRDDVWRAGRVLQRLQQEVDRRRAAFARQGVRDLPAQRAVPGAVAEPFLLLLVDGWESWSAALAEVDPGAGTDALLRLLREGSAVGVRVVVTGDRSLATSPVAATAADVLLLRLADRADAALLGVPAREVPRSQPPGRGLLLRDGTASEVQVATGSSPRPGRRALVRVAPPPAQVPVASLPPARADWVPVGVGGDDGEVVGLDLDGPVLVHGPAGSGRTTVLRVLAATADRPVVVVDGGAGPGWGPAVPRITRTSPTAAVELAARLRQAPGTLVLVDDVGRAIDPALEDLLVRCASPGNGAPGTAVVAAGDGAEVAGAFRGLAATVRSARTVLLLGRGATVGAEVLGRRPGLVPAAGPGAGFVVRDAGPSSTWTPVRLADPGPVPDAPTVEP